MQGDSVPVVRRPRLERDRRTYADGWDQGGNLLVTAMALGNPWCLGRRRTALRSESGRRAVGAGLWAWDQMWPPGVTVMDAGPAGRSTVYWRR